MIRPMLLLAAGVLFLQYTAAQDVIMLRNADEIEASVTEITDAEVKYRRFGEPNGPVRVLARADIFSIAYANGEKELFKAVTRTGDYPYPRVSRTYRVGEFFDEGEVRGLVVATTDEGRHGLLLSLDENGCMWGGVWGEEQAETFNGFECYCRNMDDGWVNMLAISDLIAHNRGVTWANFPAFAWCRNLGPGWYLPSIGEISLLWNFGEANPATTLREHVASVSALSAVLEGAGYQRVRRMVSYWTSSEGTVANQAHTWPFRPGKYVFGYKQFSQCVRAFHKF